jgi:hypothetical protein
MVLHELSHSFQHTHQDKLQPIIEAAYEAAKASGKYESVPLYTHDGQKTRHYAMNTCWEYWAECSEAYWGKNDYFPFVRSELKEFDIEAFKMCETGWFQMF